VLKEKHLKLRVVASERNSGGSKFQRGFDALGWRMAERATQESLLLGSVLDLAFTVDYNEHPEFGGVQLNLLDFAPAATAIAAQTAEG
jgi:single-stranded-DNA-specific exonuclease